MGSPLVALARLTSFVALTLLLIPLQALLVRYDWARARRLARFYHRCGARMFGFTVTVSGIPAVGRPTLFVFNHMSYLDITVIGSVLEASFVAKSEVSAWPLFGLLAKLQRTVFVDRKRGSTARQRDGIGERLAAGDDLILFPEGTSNDGTHVLPFKSALFSVADRAVGGVPLTVQPVSLAYVTLDGMPLGRAGRLLFAWFGDMNLLDHLWRAAGLGHCGIELTFHPPVSLAELGSRKALAAYCQRVVMRGVAASLAGRGAKPHIKTEHEGVLPAAAPEPAATELAGSPRP